MLFTSWLRDLVSRLNFRHGRQRRGRLPRRLSARPLRLQAPEDRTRPTGLNVTTPLDVIDPDDGLLSLREAIEAANDITTNPGLDTIEFHIPGTGPHTI